MPCPGPGRLEGWGWGVPATSAHQCSRFNSSITITLSVSEGTSPGQSPGPWEWLSARWAYTSGPLYLLRGPPHPRGRAPHDDRLLESELPKQVVHSGLRDPLPNRPPHTHTQPLPSQCGQKVQQRHRCLHSHLGATLWGATHMTKGTPVLNREGDSLMFGSLCPRDSRACLGRMAGHLGQGLGWGKGGPSSSGGKRWHSPVHLHTSQAGGPLGPSHILSL